MKNTIFAIFSFSIFFQATVLAAYDYNVEKGTLQETAFKAIEYALQEQVKTSSKIYIAGEWPTKIDSTFVPVLVGVGRLTKQEDEASAFTTGSVINQLASVYFGFPQLQKSSLFKRIPMAVQNGTTTFERYREGDLYNFYPARDWRGVRVHQPIAMSLAGIWKGFTNIPQDADTTSVTYAARTYNDLMNGSNLTQLTSEVKSSFSLYRDDHRNPHFYNRFENRKKTGAFLTWLMNEKDPKMPRYYFSDPAKGVRIPFNKNDVDCVVNLNVLKMLALHKADIPGHREACDLINDMIAQNQHATCGIYYPNTYNLVYAAALTQQAGESCLQEQNKMNAVTFILKNQSADGGWSNDKNIWQDRTQSTAFAMNALLEFGNLDDRRVQASLRYGTAYLLRQARVSKDGKVFWNAEVFFTATAIARSLIVWRSQAYTNLTVAHVLLKMQEKFPQLDANYYFKLN